MDFFIRLHYELLTSGLLREMGADRLQTLVVLAFHMKANGRCYPPQDKMARILGISRQAVNKRIKNLLDFEFQGKPIVELITDEDIDRRNNVYRVLPISQVAIFGGKVEPLNVSSGLDTITGNMSFELDTNNIKKNNNNNINNSDETSKPLPVENFNNAPGALNYFCKKYRETYGVEYNVSYKRDASMIKNKLLKNYSMTQIKDIIDITFEQYDHSWATQGYPRPTIGQLVTWIPNKALAILQAREKKLADIKKAMEAPRPSMEDLLARMERGLG